MDRPAMSPSPASPSDTAQERAALLELLAAETQLSHAVQQEERLTAELGQLQAWQAAQVCGRENAVAAMQQRSLRLELEAAQSHRQKAQQWEAEARQRLSDTRRSLTAKDLEKVHDRLRAQAEAQEIQARVAEAMAAPRPPPPPESPTATPAQRAMYTPAWFRALPRPEYQALLERYVFPDLDHLNWCMVPEVSEFLEAGVYGEGYRDIDHDEWVVKHQEWQIISEKKIKFQQQFDGLHQQMVDALLAVERRTRAHLVTECERARMFLYMELTLCAIELRERATQRQAEAKAWRSLTAAFRDGLTP